MAEKTPVTLVVSDIDNTISDYFENWGAAWDSGIGKLAQSRGLDKEKLYKEIQKNTKGYARYHNFDDILEQTPSLSLEGKSAEERKRLEKIDAKICHDVSKQYHEGNKFYDGTLATIRKIKASGAQFVLYTDSPVSGAIARLADMKFPIELLDGLVCRSDCTCAKTGEECGSLFKKAPMQVTGATFDTYRDQLVEKLGDKLVINPDGVWKPNPTVMQGILDRHGATPEQTVMVGDSIKSDGGAVALGVHFAWQKEGSAASELAQGVNSRLNDQSDYRIGTESHLEGFAELKQKDPELGRKYDEKMVVLEGGFKDLDKHFRFMSAEKAKTVAKTNETVQSAVIARRMNGR